MFNHVREKLLSIINFIKSIFQLVIIKYNNQYNYQSYQNLHFSQQQYQQPPSQPSSWAILAKQDKSTRVSSVRVINRIINKPKNNNRSGDKNSNKNFNNSNFNSNKKTGNANDKKKPKKFQSI